MNNHARGVWFALCLPRSGIGFPLEIPIKERQSYLNWAKRRGLRLLAEFTSYLAASRAVQRWQSVHRRSFPARVRTPTESFISRSEVSGCRELQNLPS
jgi:hypothetical protein